MLARCVLAVALGALASNGWAAPWGYEPNPKAQIPPLGARYESAQRED
jgi:hypothetical protein